jgi:hypothetical protein
MAGSCPIGVCTDTDGAGGAEVEGEGPPQDMPKPPEPPQAIALIVKTSHA